jgi:hypothetical protein
VPRMRVLTGPRRLMPGMCARRRVTRVGRCRCGCVPRVRVLTGPRRLMPGMRVLPGGVTGMFRRCRSMACVSVGRHGMAGVRIGCRMPGVRSSRVALGEGCVTLRPFAAVRRTTPRDENTGEQRGGEKVEFHRQVIKSYLFEWRAGFPPATSKHWISAGADAAEPAARLAPSAHASAASSRGAAGLPGRPRAGAVEGSRGCGCPPAGRKGGAR